MTGTGRPAAAPPTTGTSKVAAACSARQAGNFVDPIENACRGFLSRGMKGCDVPLGNKDMERFRRSGMGVGRAELVAEEEGESGAQ